MLNQSHQLFLFRRFAFLLRSSAVVLLFCTTSYGQLTINRNFVAPGESYTTIFVTADDAPATIAGGGTLQNVFNAAADWWEWQYRNIPAETTAIYYGWGDLPTFARSSSFQFDSFPGGDIRFDSDGTTRWFIDPTPYAHEEWTNVALESGLFGGTELISSSQQFTGYQGPLVTGSTAKPHDLFTLALHEIGHALGAGTTNHWFEDFGDGDIDIDGTSIEIPVSGGHLTVNKSLMRASVGAGQRRLISQVDALAIQDVSRISTPLADVMEILGVGASPFDATATYDSGVTPGPGTEVRKTMAGSTQLELSHSSHVGNLEVTLGELAIVTNGHALRLHGDLLQTAGQFTLDDLMGGVEVDGDLTQTGGTLSVGLSASPGNIQDLIEIDGDATFGGELEVTLLNGFEPAIGDMYEILTANSVSGSFTTENLPALIGMDWSVNYGGNNVVLEVIEATAGDPADFNGDGMVDGLDLAQWQGDFGSGSGSDADGDLDSDGADFLAWQRAHGSGTGAAFSAMVPEPTTMILSLAAALLAITYRDDRV